MPHVEQDLLTLPEHLRSPLVFGGVRVVYSLVFYVVSCVLLFFCLSFSFVAMALSVCFRFMSLTVPLVSFVPLLDMAQLFGILDPYCSSTLYLFCFINILI